MKTIDGAESHVEDDLNEDGEMTDDDHKEATRLAMDVISAIRQYPGVLLAMARREQITAELHEMPATAMTAEQQIRLALTTQILKWDWDVIEGHEVEFAAEVAATVDPLAEYVATGRVEPLPTLDLAGAADVEAQP